MAIFWFFYVRLQKFPYVIILQIPSKFSLGLKNVKLKVPLQQCMQNFENLDSDVAMFFLERLSITLQTHWKYGFQQSPLILTFPYF